jgi:glycyl-tRNA synthetase beta chain
VQACREFLRLPPAATLAAANKRIRNILRKASDALPLEVDGALLVEREEQALTEAVAQARSAIAPLLEARRYAEVLTRLAELGEPVDAFFDRVLVMSEDARIRANRLRLLKDISDLFLQIADVSRLPG